MRDLSKLTKKLESDLRKAAIKAVEEIVEQTRKDILARLKEMTR